MSSLCHSDMSHVVAVAYSDHKSDYKIGLDSINNYGRGHDKAQLVWRLHEPHLVVVLSICMHGQGPDSPKIMRDVLHHKSIT